MQLPVKELIMNYHSFTMISKRIMHARNCQKPTLMLTACMKSGCSPFRTTLQRSAESWRVKIMVTVSATVSQYCKHIVHVEGFAYIEILPGRNSSLQLLSGKLRAPAHCTSLGLGETCSKIYKWILIMNDNPIPHGHYTIIVHKYHTLN